MYCIVWETVQIQSQRQYNKWESHGLIIGSRISGPQRQTEDHKILKERGKKKKTMFAKKESIWKGRSAERRMCENHATKKLQTTHKKLQIWC